MGRTIHIGDQVDRIAWLDKNALEESITLNESNDTFTVNSCNGEECTLFAADIPKIIKALELAVKEGWNE